MVSAPPTPTPSDEADLEGVRLAAARVLSSSEFRNSERVSRFLRFAVERTLTGESAALKEYRIGVEVFGRSAAFDPRLDPVVRLEARRVRLKLERYYESEGVQDPIRINMPKGGYGVTFSIRSAEPVERCTTPEKPPVVVAPAPQQRPRWAQWIGSAAVLLAVLGAVSLPFNLWRPQTISAGRATPSVAVLPFLNLTGKASQDYLSDGIADDLTSTLARIPGIRVVARTSAFQFKGKAGDVRQIGKQLSVSSLVEGSVQSAGDTLTVNVQMVRVADGYQIWSFQLAAEPQQSSRRGTGDPAGHCTHPRTRCQTANAKRQCRGARTVSPGALLVQPPLAR
jgi:TolB-like protein